MLLPQSLAAAADATAADADAAAEVEAASVATFRLAIQQNGLQPTHTMPSKPFFIKHDNKPTSP